MKTITNKFKFALVAVGILAIGTVNAQTTDPTTLIKDTDPTKTVKLIDNKGTIKYLQSNNGITQITSTAPGNRTTTTWQLGGTLTADTDINTGAQEFKVTIDGAAGGTFVIDGIQEETGSAATTVGGTGYTLLVRDETTGEVKNLLATDLIQSGQERFVATDGQTAFALTGVTDLPSFSQVYVYRNGAKLIAGAAAGVGVDYTAAAGTVTLDFADEVDPNDWTVYAGDVIEVHFVK